MKGLLMQQTSALNDPCGIDMILNPKPNQMFTFTADHHVPNIGQQRTLDTVEQRANLSLSLHEDDEIQDTF